MKKIDSHQHFWQYDPDRHTWINDRMKVLKQDFLPPDLKEKMDKVGIDGCVAVQADQTEAETEFLLSLADEYGFIEGVVGWLDIRAENLEEKLDHYIRYEAFKGLRHIVQDEPDDRFLLQSDFLKGIETLSNYNLTYDILIYARHLPVAVEFANKFPDQKFVVDHIAKPEIKEQNIDTWADGIRELAQHPNMYCKVSGMVTEADWQHWKPEDFNPYMDVVFDAFGTEKLIFGSDWPVCTLAANYYEVFGLLDNYIQDFTDRERERIMGGNAQTFYNLD
jgi:L-fuconolactonase